MSAVPFWREQAARHFLAHHGPWLVIVLLAAAFGQWLVLRDGIGPVVSSDSTLFYLPDANQFRLLDPAIPPGYPLFLAAVFLLGGHDNVDAVLVAQAVLVVAASVETYVLLTVLTRKPMLATVGACLVASAPWLIQWERYVLGEAFAYWVVITLLLVFTRLARRPSIGWASAAGAVAAILPATRPALVLVPATLVLVMLLAAIRARLVGAPARGLAGAAFIFAICSYLPVGVYVTANATINKCNCYTNISNINLLGKIYEYQMQGLPPDPKYATISSQVRASGSINQFLYDHPEYKDQNYAPLGAYARSQLLRYPRLTLRRTASELTRVWTLPIDHAVLAPVVYDCSADLIVAHYRLMTADGLVPEDVLYCVKTPVDVGSIGENVNHVDYLAIYVAYLLLPLDLLVGVILAWMRPQRVETLMLLASAAVVASTIFAATIAGYEAFDRLKIPIDGLVVVAAILMLSELWAAAGRVWLSRRVRPAAAL